MELASSPNEDMMIQVHWIFSSKTKKNKKFKKVMKEVFIGDGDRKFIDIILDKKSMNMVSLEV